MFAPDLAASLHNLALRLAALGRREDALAASQEAVAIRGELAARWPDAYHHHLEHSLRVVPGLSTARTPVGTSPQELEA